MTGSIPAFSAMFVPHVAPTMPPAHGSHVSAMPARGQAAVASPAPNAFTESADASDSGPIVIGDGSPSTSSNVSFEEPPPPPTDPPTYPSFEEDIWQVPVVVVRSGTLTQAAAVDYATTGGTATADTDYGSVSGTLVFQPSETEQTIYVPVYADTVTEGSETVELTLSHPQNTSLGTITVTYFNITDESPSVSFAAASANGWEEDGTAEMIVSLSAPSNQSVTVNYATTAGTAATTDFVASKGTVTFAAGETSQVISVPLLDDASAESNETFTIALSSPSNATLGSPSSTTITVHDDDRPIVTITASDPESAETGANGGSFTISRTGPTDEALTVPLTIGGSATPDIDYLEISDTVIIPIGVNDLILPITIINDDWFEGGETIIVNIEEGGDYDIVPVPIGVITIGDDPTDPKPVVSIRAQDPLAAELPHDDGLFVVSRSGPLTTALAVALTLEPASTATSGLDYLPISLSVNFAPGVAAVPIPLIPLDDSLVEGTESVIVSVQPSAAYVVVGGPATVSITDDDTINIRVDADNNGVIDSQDDLVEDNDPGAIVFYNNSDDNRNIITDVDETGVVAGELDLREVQLILPANLEDYFGWEAVLTNDAPTRIALWLTPQKGLALGATTTWEVGVDPIPPRVWMEGVGVGAVNLNWRLVDPAGFLQPLIDNARATAAKFDLDVNADKAFAANEGAATYLPGYDLAGSPVITSGGFNAEPPAFTPQSMNLLLQGVGSNIATVQSVTFRIGEVTQFPGIDENQTDLLRRKGRSDTNDYSFSSSTDYRGPASIDNGDAPTDSGAYRLGMEATRAYVSFWAKDFGGYAEVRCEIKLRINGQHVSVIKSLQVPRSVDRQQDYIADIWEKQQWDLLRSQHAYNQAGAPIFPYPDPLTFFNGADDGEFRDADSPAAEANPNLDGDGGRNLPAHRGPGGDGLMEFQEYRGFVLDGGDGVAGSGHQRLTAVFKEVLLEVDIMDNGVFTGVISPTTAATILTRTTAGFSDLQNGAGVRAYWVIDNPVAWPHLANLGNTVITDSHARWAAKHRHNDNLNPFVHLMFADTDVYGRIGVSGTFGTYVFMGALQKMYPPVSGTPSPHLNPAAAGVAAHELTHCLQPLGEMDKESAGPFDEERHNLNGDPSNPKNSLSDTQFIMYKSFPGRSWQGPIVSANSDINVLDPASKWSVERK